MPRVRASEAVEGISPDVSVPRAIDEDITYDPDRLVAAGGWWAPAPALYRMEEILTLPDITVNRGGITYPRPPAPGTKEYERQRAERAAAEALQTLILRYVGNIVQAQNQAVDTAVITALSEGYEVHVQHNHSYRASRFVGIDLRDRGPESPLVTYHYNDHMWEAEEWDDEDA